MNNKNIIKSKKIKFPILVLVFALLTFTCFSCTFKSKNVLPSWEDSSQNKQDIINFVKDVTDEKSPDFVPVEDRIAVFDADGTYYCEKGDFASNYFGRFVADYRLKNDPTFKPSDELKAAIDNGFITQDQQLEILSSLTHEQMTNLLAEFKKTPHPCFNNLTFGEAFYKPMLELMDYLKENNFKIYVFSGTDPDTLRSMAEGTLSIPSNQICGSRVKVSANGFENYETSKYNMQQNDTIKRTKEYISDDYFEKVNSIYNAIGKQPIFAAGNTSGDYSMLNYTNSNPKYKSFTFMVFHDDDSREFAYPTGAKLEQLENDINTYGYHKVSMKNEFKTIFKDDVTKKAPSEYRIYQED